MVVEKLACLEELLSLEAVSSLAVSLRQQCLAFQSSARLEKELTLNRKGRKGDNTVLTRGIFRERAKCLTVTFIGEPESCNPVANLRGTQRCR